MSRAKTHKGSSVESFLEEENILAEAEIKAIKRVIAYEVAQAMKRKNLNKTKAAEAMGTSRSQLDRLLDEDNGAITLNTLAKAALFSNKKLHLVFK